MLTVPRLTPALMAVLKLLLPPQERTVRNVWEAGFDGSLTRDCPLGTVASRIAKLEKLGYVRRSGELRWATPQGVAAYRAALAAEEKPRRITRTGGTTCQ